MTFWLAAIVGGLFAWAAVQVGFYATWTMFFHLLLSVSMAILLAPMITSSITATAATSCGYGLTLMCVAVATFAVSFGICKISLSGQGRVEFPKAFDTVIAGLVGFFGGFLLLSFMAIMLSLTPLSEVGFCKAIGLTAEGQTANTAYVCWWCDWVHLLVGAGETASSGEALHALQTKAMGHAPQVAQASPSPPSPKPPSASPAPPPVPKAKLNAASAPAPPKAGSEAAGANNRDSAQKAPDESQRQPSETLEEELARRRVVVNSLDDVVMAIANPQVKIIEVADACTGDKFDPKRIELLRHWVSEGGVLWANNDVLSLFGIKHTKLVWWGSTLDCMASPGKEQMPMLAGCRKVVLKNAGGKAHTLAAKGVVPLLGLEKDVPFEAKAGTSCWSLVPYGKGWISNTKTVDTTQYDGEKFWTNFGQFCLGRRGLIDTSAGKKSDASSNKLAAKSEKPSVNSVKPTAPSVKPAANGEKPTPSASSKGPLSGVWQTSTGAKFRIEDDGQVITINWIAGDRLRSLTGTLDRDRDDPSSKILTGRMNAVFAFDASKSFVIDVTATITDSNSLRIRSADWPVWNNSGKCLGTRPRTDVWARSGNPAK